MKRSGKILLFALLASAFGAKAQDMHFTQFYSSPLYLNPAYSGADVCSRVSGTFRNQWPGISKTYKTYLFGFDHYIQKYNIGVGLLFGSDVAGTGDLKTTIICPMIAYEAKMTKKLMMRAGVSPGLGLRSINMDKLLFGDQIARGGNVATLESPVQTRAYFNIDAGLLAYTKKYWIGVAFFHLNRPNESLRGDAYQSPLPIKYSVHGGYKYNINPDEKEETKQQSISFAFNYRGQREFDQLEMGAYFTKYVFNVGLWYRGIPLFKAYKPGYTNDDAFAIIIGVNTGRMNIGYSYDITISKLALATRGAHEVCVSYQLCKLTKKKKKRLLVPCPKF
jgi:type IX secretion system PorP/SprF family membrane protein